MKLKLTLALFLLYGVMFAQNLVVIDKTEENEQFFERGTPGSLLDLIFSESSYFTKFYKQGISEKDFNFLPDSEKEKFKLHIGRPGTTPLINEHPEHPGFGEPVIDTLPDGTMTFVYNAPDTVLISDADISRIIFEFGDGELIEEDAIVRITLCRLFQGKYMTVLTLGGLDLLSLRNFEYFTKMEQSDVDELMGDNQDSYKKVIKKDYLNGPSWHEKYKFITDYDYFLPMNEPLVTAKGEILSVEASYRLNLLNMEAPSTVDSLNKYFGEIEYEWLPGTIPKIVEDPADPNFGEPIIIIDSAGKESFVFDPPIISFNWLDYDPIVYVKASYNSIDDVKTSSNVEMLYFTLDYKGEELVVAKHRIGPYLNEKYFDSYSPEFNWTNWRLNLLEDIKSHGQNYDVTDPNLNKKLKLTSDYPTR